MLYDRKSNCNIQRTVSVAKVSDEREPAIFLRSLRLPRAPLRVTSNLVACVLIRTENVQTIPTAKKGLWKRDLHRLVAAAHSTAAAVSCEPPRTVQLLTRDQHYRRTNTLSSITNSKQTARSMIAECNDETFRVDASPRRPWRLSDESCNGR